MLSVSSAGQWRRVALLAMAGLFALLGLAGCRGQPMIMEVWETDDDLVIEVVLDTCNADVSVAIEEFDDRIVLTARDADAHAIDTGGDDCQDLVRVELERSLGDRRVVDSSGSEIVVVDTALSEGAAWGDLPDVEPPGMFDPPTDAELEDLAFIAERDGLSLGEVVRDYGWRRGFSQLVEEIRNRDRRSFSGAAVEPNGSAWIAFKGAVPADVPALVEQFEREAIRPLGSSTRIELVPDRGFSAGELNGRVMAAHRAVYNQSPFVSDVVTGADPRTGKISMTVQSVGPDLVETLADVRSRVADDVEVHIMFAGAAGFDGVPGVVSAVVHEVRVTDDERVIEVVLETCNAEVSVDVDESDDRIVVHAMQHDWERFLLFRNDCLDHVVVELAGPLGDRAVVSASGEVIAVVRP